MYPYIEVDSHGLAKQNQNQPLVISILFLLLPFMSEVLGKQCGTEDFMGRLQLKKVPITLVHCRDAFPLAVPLAV